jgi:2-polyprenyl-6-methoxyphenol hydroxylase-like FAD-dependent oxidoreductase
LYGYHGDHPTSDENDFLDFAKSLVQPDIYEVIKTLTPQTKPKIYKIPKMTRNYFEKVKDLPEEILVIGDAYCRLDPVFGQGISVAILEALELQKVLQKRLSVKKLQKRFFKRISRLVDVPWLVVKSESLRFDHVGNSSTLVRFLQKYNERIFAVSSADKDVYQTFIKVMDFIEHPIKLFSPSTLIKVLLKK